MSSLCNGKVHVCLVRTAFKHASELLMAGCKDQPPVKCSG